MKELFPKYRLVSLVLGIIDLHGTDFAAKALLAKNGS
jgi:hypothetical protein